MFTCPYVSSPSFPNRDVSADPLMAAAAASLAKDVVLKRAASELKEQFLGKCQALIHGDLHSGSIMVTPTVSQFLE